MPTTPGARDDIRAFLSRGPDSVLVEVAEVKGSAPRDAGAWMLVSRDAIFRTIGGGQLEYMAIDHARRLLAGGDASPMDVPLGPEIGQCCGGRVGLSFRRVDRALAASLVARVDDEIALRPHVYVFGAGHVGDALAHALSLTPVRVTLVDTREAELMKFQEKWEPVFRSEFHESRTISAAPGVETCLTALPEQVVRQAPAGSAFIVLTHDHALDFLIAAEALRRRDAAYVGMIGSRTKKATFKHWLKREADDALFDRLVCPVGGAAVKDKRPEVIAALATAEVLTALLTPAPRG